MPRPSPAPGRRTPVLVVQTDEDPSALAHRLAAAAVGSGIDLWLENEPILPDSVEESARARATADLPERRAAYRRLEAELTSSIDAAAAHHHEVAALADRSAERRKELLEGAFWCEGKRALVLELDAELAGADQTVGALAAAVAVAVAALSDLEAAQATLAQDIEDAHRQLLELELAGRPEEELRRDLVTARQVAEEAATAALVAAQRIEELRREIAVGEARSAEIAAELERLGSVLAADPAPIAAALERLDVAPLVDADPSSLRLADDLERLTAELAALPRTPPGPDDATLAAAEATAATANETLELVRRPLVAAEPLPWWDELTRLHAAVVDAETAVESGGFGRKGNQRRLEEAKAAERALLDEVGYGSHLDAVLSGGRPMGAGAPGRLSLAVAEEAAAAAEQRLLELRAAAEAAAAHTRIRHDLGRLRALGGALSGTSATAVTPDGLRGQRVDPDATEAVWDALAVAGVRDRSGGASATAQAWLAARSEADARLPSLTAEARSVDAELTNRTSQLPGAEADGAEYGAAATIARREVAALESELAHRAEHPLDPAARALADAEIRQRIDDLERSNSAALAMAADAVEVARQEHGAAVERREVAEREVAEYRIHAATLAALLDAEQFGGPVDDLGSLAAALRAEVTQLDLQITDGRRKVAHAAAALAAARAAQASHQATDATDPTAFDRASILAALLEPGSRTTDLVVEPARGLGPGGYEVILDQLAAVGAHKQVVVVTADDRFVAWAIEQPGRLVAVVPAASVDPGPSVTDRIDTAQAPSEL